MNDGNTVTINLAIIEQWTWLASVLCAVASLLARANEQRHFVAFSSNVPLLASSSAYRLSHLPHGILSNIICYVLGRLAAVLAYASRVFVLYLHTLTHDRSVISHVHHGNVIYPPEGDSHLSDF